MKTRRERLRARLARAQAKLAAAHAAVKQWQATCNELQAQLADEEDEEDEPEARSDGSVSGGGSDGDDDGEEEEEEEDELSVGSGSDDPGGGGSEHFPPAPHRRCRSRSRHPPEDVPGDNSDLEEPSDDDEEPPAPPIPAPQEEELAEETALSTELGINVTELCDWVIKQVKPVEGELRFKGRKYVRTLLVATQRARRRHPEHEGFVFPPEVEQLVCGGATQARARRAVALARLRAAAVRGAARPLVLLLTPRVHGPRRVSCAGGQNDVRRGRRRRRLRCTSAVRGASTPRGEACLPQL
jgi:hypothetical protein